MTTAVSVDSGARVLVDTNVLLRLLSMDTKSHLIAQLSFKNLQVGGAHLYTNMQNFSEFWNAATRPQTSNGLGLSTAAASGQLRTLESQVSLLIDTLEVYKQWRMLVEQYAVVGKQVHDAKLTASMFAHNVPFILTFNGEDFRRYSGVTVLNPQELA